MTQLDAQYLNMVNVVTGVKGSGKSHMAKQLVIRLAANHVPVVVFDVNGEYVNLPNARVFHWGRDFRPTLDEVGYIPLIQLVKETYRLPETSESVFSTTLPRIWDERQQFCQTKGIRFTLDINHLEQYNWPGHPTIVTAIHDRLQTVARMRLFHDYKKDGNPSTFQQAYERAVVGEPIIFDMRTLATSSRKALVHAVTDVLEQICQVEADDEQGQGRFPFVFYEEAHLYVTDQTIVNIITRGRHIGIGSVFVTNTPQELPRTVFRQLDNLFLLGLTHNDDIKNVSNSSFTDEETIRSFSTRMPKYHALIIGNVTLRYPLVVKVDDLPQGVPASGRTRSTWDRFRESEVN